MLGEHRFSRGLSKGGPMRLIRFLASGSIALLAASAAGAEQGEARLQQGPMTERPVIRVACDTGKWNQCLQEGHTACSQKPTAERANCSNGVYYTCTQQVKGCD
jgi:hypothetical protein